MKALIALALFVIGFQAHASVPCFQHDAYKLDYVEASLKHLPVRIPDAEAKVAVRGALKLMKEYGGSICLPSLMALANEANYAIMGLASDGDIPELHADQRLQLAKTLKAIAAGNTTAARNKEIAKIAAPFIAILKGESGTLVCETHTSAATGGPDNLHCTASRTIQVNAHVKKFMRSELMFVSNDINYVGYEEGQSDDRDKGCGCSE